MYIVPQSKSYRERKIRKYFLKIDYITDHGFRYPSFPPDSSHAFFFFIKNITEEDHKHECGHHRTVSSRRLHNKTRGNNNYCLELFCSSTTFTCDEKERDHKKVCPCHW